MHRRERLLFFIAAPIAGALGLFACSDEPRQQFDETDAAPDALAHLPEAAIPNDDGGVVDARVPFDASDEPIVCSAKPCVTQLVGSGSHFCALLDDKTVRCWGSGFSALGTLDGSAGHGADQPRPIAMGLSSVEQISSANQTTCVLLADGSVKCWGANPGNELGLDPPSSDYRPHDPATVTRDGGPVAGFARIDVGTYGVVFATKPSGELWSWGENVGDVLGRMNESDPYLGPGPAADLAGVKVRRAGGLTGAGQGGIGFAITDEGKLLTWGSSKRMVAYPGPVPLPVAGLENVSSAAATLYHVCAVADGRLFCWGSDGLLACTGSADAVMSPIEIRTRGEARAQQVSLYYSHTCVRLTDGTVECCGSDTSGQLGAGETDASVTQARTLTKASAFTGKAVQIAVGLQTTCALVQGGTVQCWGSNLYGQLGQGTIDNDRHPTPVTVTFD